MKPLQTHGLYNTSWSPPRPSRFVTYDFRDESWMKPLGLGTVTEVPTKLYDVRLPDDKLVGYTEHDPTKARHRALMVRCIDNWDLIGEWCQADYTKPDFRTMELTVRSCYVEDQSFLCWICHPQDAPALIESGIISLAGPDNIHQFASELRRQFWNRKYL